MKLVASSSLILALLCGPALADAPPQPSVQLKIAVASGKDVRRYDMKLVDRTCGKIDNQSPSLHDEVNACMRADAGAFQVELEWKLREGDRNLHNKSTIIAKRGETFELAHAGAKLSVTVQ